jgi:methylglutaconyl-CoA hydratase
MTTVLCCIDARGVATLTLNRPEQRNALDRSLVEELTEALERLAANADVRVVVLTASGDIFCAGGDLRSMARLATAPQEENEADARALAALFRTLDTLPKPTVALVRGAAYGGGVGLVACCDIVLAADDARFCLSEVRLGLIPAVAGPFVVRAIGARQARRLVLTAETIGANEASRIGLAHVVAPPNELPATCERTIDALLQGAPGAQAEAKALMDFNATRAIDDDLMDSAAQLLARRRTSSESREGLGAFLEKRSPDWRGTQAASKCSTSS